MITLELTPNQQFDDRRKLAYDVTVHFWQYEPFDPPRTVPNTDVWRVSYAMGSWAVKCRDIFVPDGTVDVGGNRIYLTMLTINNNVTFRDEEPTLEVIDLTDEPGPDPDDPNEPHPDWPPQHFTFRSENAGEGVRIITIIAEYNFDDHKRQSYSFSQIYHNGYDEEEHDLSFNVVYKDNAWALESTIPLFQITVELSLPTSMVVTIIRTDPHLVSITSTQR
jgi:hypothetical protein